MNKAFTCQEGGALPHVEDMSCMCAKKTVYLAGNPEYMALEDDYLAICDHALKLSMEKRKQAPIRC